MRMASVAFAAGHLHIEADVQTLHAAIYGAKPTFP